MVARRLRCTAARAPPPTLDAPPPALAECTRPRCAARSPPALDARSQVSLVIIVSDAVRCAARSPPALDARSQLSLVIVSDAVRCAAAQKLLAALLLLNLLRRLKPLALLALDGRPPVSA